MKKNIVVTLSALAALTVSATFTAAASNQPSVIFKGGTSDAALIVDGEDIGSPVDYDGTKKALELPAGEHKISIVGENVYYYIGMVNVDKERMVIDVGDAKPFPEVKED